MSNMTFELAASSGEVLDVLAAFAGGLIIAGALVGAVLLGVRLGDKESPRPRPEEQPRLPATGAIRETREMREAEEVPVAANETERLMPYQLRHAGTRRGEDQRRRRWLPGSSGSFGSGGLGHT
ncbi:DUF6479 family protein [Streptomyces sp. NPDC005574]|uniref:DUF6479 family protein n=1 Tax=Streptomyces sp. NPDC005574 TaxID=3156891 RepID=UPI0033BDF37C